MGAFLALLLLGLIGGTAGLAAYSANKGAEGEMVSKYINQVNSGQMSAQDFLAKIASAGYKLTPEQESYISSMLANQRTNEARDFESMMANTDLLRASSQLGALGLSPSNVLSVGGSAVPNVQAAFSPQINNANARLERQKDLANSFISMAGRMASSGIYGSSLFAVKSAASKAAAAAANSASHHARTIRNYDKLGDLISMSDIVDVTSRDPHDMLRY